MKIRTTRSALLSIKGLLLSALLLIHSAVAANTPLSDQLDLTGTPVYGNLAQANHVFGYQFRVLEQGQIEQVGGYFDGAKQVVIVNATNDIVASALVTGSSTGFRWSALDTPLQVDKDQTYRVLVRAGADQSSTAAWSVPMPFTQNAIEVLSLEQGWSTSVDPQIWTTTAQTLSDQHARGLVDIQFSPANNQEETPVDPDGPDEENPDSEQPPIAGDPFPATAGVVDSFGETAPTGPLGMGFMAVRSYYQDFPRRSGECSVEVHDRYWVRDSNGVTHPTWHPAVDPQTGCRFAHEHGDDPRLSPNYVFAEGVPFGITHGNGGGLMRHEDHVGHKVVVQSDWGLVDGNPQNGQQPQSDPIRRTGTSCDWLSKIHQGSWSRDALANNAHEYFLNLRCTDGVQIRLKQLVTFGPPELVTNICDNPAVNQANALTYPDFTSQAFTSGVASTSGTAVTQALDGKREFACIKNVRWKDRLEELWKSDGVIEFPGGGFINFSPYYVVLNPARYLDHRWAARGAANGYVSSLDLCFDDNDVYRGLPMGFCNSVPEDLAQLPSELRQQDIRNPMNGTRRVIHPKGIVVYTANETGSDPLVTFCTDRLGRNARILETGSCSADEIEQLVSRSDRRQWGWNGSDVNSISVEGQLRGGGYLNEWVRDFSAPGIRFPN
ncbi:hypothetical protein N9383_05280 [Granulosicoccus sp.]|nr:hypothetical protein [Granulosicoccus sp.]